MQPEPGPSRFRRRAFGLDIDAGFDGPGLPTASGAPTGRSTRVDVLAAEEIDRRWPGDGCERVLEERFPGDPAEGPAARTIDVHTEHGYRLYARGFGVARIAPGGDQIECAPPTAKVDWSWQRFLVGRVLPWAAVLRGYEAFHASAVLLGDQAVAFTGLTGAGKTSLALRLTAAGAGFLTDDVLAVEITGAGPTVHPGANLAAVRPAERAAIPETTWRRLGTELGHDEKTYMTVPIVTAPARLGALCFLEAGEGPLVEPVEQPDPRTLLASSFVMGIQTPARLLNQLDICAEIANRIPVYRVRVGPRADAGQLAEAVTEQVAGAVAR